MKNENNTSNSNHQNYSIFFRYAKKIGISSGVCALIYVLIQIFPLKEINTTTVSEAIPYVAIGCVLCVSAVQVGKSVRTYLKYRGDENVLKMQNEHLTRENQELKQKVNDMAAENEKLLANNKSLCDSVATQTKVNKRLSNKLLKQKNVKKDGDDITSGDDNKILQIKKRVDDSEAVKK